MQKEHYLLKADTTISFWQSDFNVFIYSVSLTVKMSFSFFFLFSKSYLAKRAAESAVNANVP